MRRHLTKIGLASPVLALVMVSGSLAFALPTQANAHAQSAANNASTNQSVSSNANGLTGQQRACQNREKAINNIISRINTRGQNQLTLFDTIATRVENFYTSKGNTVSNYSDLTAAIDSAKSQAQTDLAAMTGGTFSCTSNTPRAFVTAFQGDLKTEITDLKNYRTAVKNLIVAVAKANGVTVSDTSQSSTQGGQQ